MDDSEQAPKQLSRDEIRLIIDSIPSYKFFDATDAAQARAAAEKHSEKPRFMASNSTF